MNRMNIFHKFSVPELHEVLNLNEKDVKIVNALVSKIKSNEENYNIYANKRHLRSLVENIVTNDNFLDKKFRALPAF